MAKRKGIIHQSQPVFKGSSDEKQKAYSKWREAWFKATQKRTILKSGDNKPGRPR